MKEKLDIQGCIELGEAIVAKAGEDYIVIKRELLTVQDVNRKNLLLRKLKDIEGFFRSKWFMVLTDIDGRKFKSILDQKYEELRESGELKDFNKSHFFRNKQNCPCGFIF